jgi:hypothetical protein
MRIRSVNLVAFLLLSLLPVSVFANDDLHVTAASFSADFDTVTVTLSESPASAVIAYELYLNGNGYSYSSWNHEIHNTSVDSASGLRQQIMKPGSTGRGTLEIFACPPDYRSLPDDCNEPYILAINTAPLGSFSDVAEGHPNYDAIAYVHKRALVAGYEDGTFKPDQLINRAEFTKLITLAQNQQSTINKCTAHDFSDVLAGIWFERYLCQAYLTGLITGYPDRTFRPAQAISFVEAAKIIAKAFVIEEDCGGVPCPEIGDYDHPWYEASVRGLVAKHAIPLSILRFEQQITRGEMAEILYRLSPIAPNLPSTSYESLLLWKDCDERIRAGLGSCE